MIDEDAKWSFRFLSLMSLLLLLMSFFGRIFSLKDSDIIGFFGSFLLALASMAYTDWRLSEKEATS